MSELPLSEDFAAHDATTPSVAVTAGGLLRQAREAAGLHIAALAVSLKVPVKKLEALEGDRLDLLPDAVFVRALASSVCRALHIDARPVLDRLPQSAVPVLQPETDINAPFHSPRDAGSQSTDWHLKHPAVLGVLGMLIAAASIVFLPELERSLEWATAKVRGSSPLVVAPVTPLPEAGAGLKAASGQPQVVVENVPVMPPDTATTTPAAASVPMEVPQSPVAAVSAPGTLTVSPVAAGSATSGAVLAFKASASTWIEVTDAAGGVPLRRMLAAGESVTANGNPPLSVVVGRADAVEVQVRGQVFDLMPVARANVARFEVK